jgi:hypothetical protein
MYVVLPTSTSFIHRTQHLDLTICRNQVPLGFDTASVPREEEDEGGCPVVGDVGVVQEVRFEGRQDGFAGGCTILEAEDIVRVNMTLQEVPLNCSRVVDGSTEARELILFGILGWACKLHTTHTDKAAHLIDADDEGKNLIIIQ